MSKTIIKMVRTTITVRSVNERLIWIRTDMNVTQAQMGEIIGCSRSNYANKEGVSVHGFSTDQILKIGLRFNVNMNWLFYGTGRPYRAANTR